MARWGICNLEVWNTVLASIAPSTRRSYEKIFFDFVTFFDEKELTFSSVGIDTVLSFLQKFVGLSESRVRMAVAALKFFLKVYNRLDLVDHQLIAMFSKGAQNLAPLPKAKPAIWNPATVLNWLKRQALPSSFLDSAREALMLLLLATGWRVDNVWKLSAKVDMSEDLICFFFCGEYGFLDI
jgi:site-specific recombinase XerD